MNVTRISWCAVGRDDPSVDFTLQKRQLNKLDFCIVASFKCVQKCGLGGSKARSEETC